MSDNKITSITDQVKKYDLQEKSERSRKIKAGIALSQKRKEAASADSTKIAKSKAHAIRRRKVEFYTSLKGLLDNYVGFSMSEEEFESFIEKVVEKVIDDLDYEDKGVNVNPKRG